MSQIEVSYKVDGLIGGSIEEDEAIEELAKQYGGSLVNSGSGFGYRDLGFEFLDDDQGIAFEEDAIRKGLIEK